MSFKYKTHDEETYLLVEAGGEANTLEDIVEYSNAVLEAALTKGYTCVLHDQRKLAANFTQIDIINLADQNVAMDAQSSGIRAAVVCSEHNLDIIRFLETAFQNRSLQLRTFTDMTSAEEWLACKEQKYFS